MQTMTWRGSRLHIQSHNVQVAGQQLDLRRCYGKTGGPVVVMVAGFLETTELFMPRKGRGGLAAFLASQGFDIYLAELRGRGKSWPLASDGAAWGLHELICEDIPAHLRSIDKLRPGEPQFWLGHGLGSLLLAAHYARAEKLPAPLLGMVHFAPFRRCNQDSRKYRRWSFGLEFVRRFRGHAARAGGESPRRESARVLTEWKQWHASEDWLDPADQFDYGAALRSLRLPPTLYFALPDSSLWGSTQDCRRLIADLGEHNGRLLAVSKRGGNLRNYSGAGLMRHPGACDDHFLQLQAWLDEQLTAASLATEALRAAN